MAYRRDVGYYHQVSISLYSSSLLICVFIFKAQLCQQWDLNGILGRQQLLYIVINPAVLMETKDTTGILTIKPATMRFP